MTPALTLALALTLTLTLTLALTLTMHPQAAAPECHRAGRRRSK